MTAPRQERNDVARSRRSDKNRYLPGRLCLVIGIRRERRDGELPQPIPFGLVIHLAHLHRAHRCLVAEIDMRIGAQIVYPDRVLRRSTLRPDEDVAVTVLDPHKRRLADGAGLIARMRYDDHG